MSSTIMKNSMYSVFSSIKNVLGEPPFFISPERDEKRDKKEGEGGYTPFILLLSSVCSVGTPHYFSVGCVADCYRDYSIYLFFLSSFVSSGFSWKP